MRRILLITTSYPASLANGKEAAGSFVADFAQELAERVDVTVLAPGDGESTESVTGLRVHRFAGPGRPLSLLNPSNPAHWLSIWRVLQQGSQLAHRLARRYEFDHVLAFWVLPSGHWARRLNQQYGIPYSVWALGSDIWSLGRLPFIRGVLREVLRDSTSCFADGHALRNDVEQLSGRPCLFLPSVRRLPVRGGKRLRNEPPYRLAYLGRWHRNKGVDLLLDALTLLDDEDWRRIEALKICGGGPLDPLVHSRGAMLSTAGRPVRVHGYLDKQGAAELLEWTDYLIISSRVESIPVIFSDAVQAGCALVTTPVGDLPRLMQEYRLGVLADGTGARAIATAIRRATTQPPAAYAPNLLNAKKHFSLDNACAQFLNVVGLGSP